jgi:hypothetical protein
MVDPRLKLAAGCPKIAAGKSASSARRSRGRAQPSQARLKALIVPLGGEPTKAFHTIPTASNAALIAASRAVRVVASAA